MFKIQGGNGDLENRQRGGMERKMFRASVLVGFGSGIKNVTPLKNLLTFSRLGKVEKLEFSFSHIVFEKVNRFELKTVNFRQKGLSKSGLPDKSVNSRFLNDNPIKLHSVFHSDFA